MSQTYIYRLLLTEKYHSPESFGPAMEIFQQHFAYLQDATERGQAIVVGRTDVDLKDNFGIVIFTAESEDAARDFMNADPCVKHGVMRAEVYPFLLLLHNLEAAEKALPVLPN